MLALGSNSSEGERGVPRNSRKSAIVGKAERAA
jgi:hypothetical protein